MSNTYSISVETGGYRQLDLFAERCGEGNAVVTVADGNGVAIAAHTMPIAERRHHFLHCGAAEIHRHRGGKRPGCTLRLPFRMR